MFWREKITVQQRSRCGRTSEQNTSRAVTPPACTLSPSTTWCSMIMLLRHRCWHRSCLAGVWEHFGRSEQHSKRLRSKQRTEVGGGDIIIWRLVPSSGRPGFRMFATRLVDLGMPAVPSCPRCVAVKFSHGLPSERKMCGCPAGNYAL